MQKVSVILIAFQYSMSYENFFLYITFLELITYYNLNLSTKNQNFDRS